MAKKKRKTRKQLLKEPDEFITFTGKLIKFGTEYSKQIIIATSAIFIFLIGISTLNYFQKKASDEAFMLLKKAQANYDEILKKDGTEKAYNDMAKDFENILNKYPNQYGGQLARVVYANINFNNGKYDRAIELYTKSLKDFDNIPFFKNMIINGLGLSFEKKGDYNKAKHYFEMITNDESSILHGEALYNIGLIHASEGNMDKSIRAFENMVTKNPDSMYIEIVKEKIGQ